ncbi:hypothetical protein LEP3755_64800 (plasmid) [Leptolyngbya sp. NIES-3755]|nr:hypothetical protein LEP3755_64800 [Leptolyngbya sp. NIES-3755]
MRNHLTELSRWLELIFCLAFIAITAVMLVFHQIYLGLLYLGLAALLSPIPILRRLPPEIRFCAVLIGVFL